VLAIPTGSDANARLPWELVDDLLQKFPNFRWPQRRDVRVFSARTVHQVQTPSLLGMFPVIVLHSAPR